MVLKKSLAATILAVMILLTSVSLYAGSSPAIEGVHTKIPGEKFNFDGKTVEVVELMSFYCHTCYEFEKYIPVIRGNFPKKIKWITLPVYWGENSSPKPGEAYLLAEEAGKGEAMKKALFEAHMVQKADIADISVLEEIAGKVGLGPEFGKKLRNGDKAEEAQKALNMARKVGVSETPTLIIAGNIKTDPHAMNHDLNLFKINALAIIDSILKN
ncbi:MAG: DsbA family protein [Nitrospirota bacterium]